MTSTSRPTAAEFGEVWTNVVRAVSRLGVDAGNIVHALAFPDWDFADAILARQIAALESLQRELPKLEAMGAPRRVLLTLKNYVKWATELEEETRPLVAARVAVTIEKQKARSASRDRKIIPRMMAELPRAERSAHQYYRELGGTAPIVSLQQASKECLPC